jgi:hypothetical protein
MRPIRSNIQIYLNILILIFLSACAASPAAPPSQKITPGLSLIFTPTVEWTTTKTLGPIATITPTTLPSFTPSPQASGPDSYPIDVNPLSGLPIQHPENIFISPALVSITNYPVTARPQAGLSFSPMIYEFYIGEGASRFLAVFYGDYPSSPENDDRVEIGPIRSGRLPYEALRQLYNGFMVIASASPRVLSNLGEYHIINNPDYQTDINGAKINVGELKDIARSTSLRIGSPVLTGLRFDPQVPPSGKPATKVWVYYHYTDQIFWKYDKNTNAYLRYQNDGEDTPLKLYTDRLTNEPLTIENLIILYTQYHRYDETLFDIDFQYILRYPALLFRDGQMFNIFWTTRNDTYEKLTGKFRPMRYIDEQGYPFPLKPGQTWVEVMQLNNPYYETIDSEAYHVLSKVKQPGSGIWAVRFLSPDFEELLDKPK